MPWLRPLPARSLALILGLLAGAMTTGPAVYAQESAPPAAGSDAGINPEGANPEATNPRAGERLAPAGRTGLPLPRFVSLRSAEVNVRTGPGTRYPIEWVYQRRGMPVEIVDEFDTWRRIRDWQGTEGWVHQSMVQGQRGILVTGKRRTLHRRPEPDSPGVALIDAGVIGVLTRCQERACEVTVDGFTGWLERDTFYGLYPGEKVE
jgi:SH3-like domain-containing protein